MKFQVNRDVFSDAVSFAVKLLAQRPTQPILSGVLISAKKDALTLSTFDYEVSARTQIAAEVETEGVILVSGRLLAEIANKLPQQAPVNFTTQSNQVQITCGSAKFTLLTMPIEEYPSIPEVGEETGLVPAEAFSEAISRVAIASSRDDVTPVITGIQLEMSKNTLSLLATDRYRVAISETPWDSGSVSKEEETPLTALIPARTLQEVGKTFGQTGNISVSLTRREDRELIAFTAANKTVTSLLIKGNFPPVRRLFPENVENFAVLNTVDLRDAVGRVQLVLEREAALRFTFSNESLLLEALGSDQAQASESINAIITGGDTVVSLKPQFLSDGLSSVRSEFVRISFTKTDNPNKPGPVLITSQTSREQKGSDTFRYLLQPNLLMR